MATKEMRKRWADLGDRLYLPLIPRAHVFAILRDSYREPHRAYHTLEHIEFCLEELDRVHQQALERDAVEMALWYHDAIYDTKRNDNEERSADFAQAVLRKLNQGPEFCDRVASLILATKHTGRLIDPDEQLIADIDLASLGTGWEAFAHNTRKIRQEYKHVPHEEFVEERRAILRKFLERERLYYLPSFRTRYEVKARNNIERSIAEMNELTRLP